jgi:hypothetical protein
VVAAVLVVAAVMVDIDSQKVIPMGQTVQND